MKQVSIIFQEEKHVDKTTSMLMSENVACCCLRDLLNNTKQYIDNLKPSEFNYLGIPENL